MADGQLRTLLRHWERTRARQDAGGMTDGQLLERFALQRHEPAFEDLVRRHGAMVLNVSRRLLGDGPDTEDAFQATFLMLVRKAGAIHKQEAVASWLYKVAYRVALRARERAARRARRERGQVEVPAPAADDAVWRDLRPVLDQEVNRLPEKYRQAVVLCYLSGKTTEEAARQLGCARGTILSRLAWARQRLRSRLVRRGLALSAAALASALAQNAASAVLSPMLVDGTIKAALWYAAGKAVTAGVLSRRAVTLMEGVLHAMFLNKVKVVLVAVLVLAVLGAGLGLWNRQTATADPVERRKDEVPRATTRTAEEPGTQARAYAVPEEVRRPLGTWEREIGPYHMTLRIEGEHLYGTLTGVDPQRGLKETIHMDCDYSLTRDSLLYGVVTSVDVPEGPKEDQEEADLDFWSDQPFSLRCRLDGNTLTLKDLKLGVGMKEEEAKPFHVILGRYKKKTSAIKEDNP
jgi:RNA polymerase sigma factor (sigma-70 family)